MTQAPVDRLCALLDLEPIEVNIFRGVSPDASRQRVFGGQVAGQALVAAARTLDDERPVHSLHAYFLRPGDPAVPILYEVDRIRDGRSFATRRVVAIQHGRAIFNLAASFHAPEDGLEHQIDVTEVMWDGRDAPDPETLPDWRERMAPFREHVPHYDEPRPIDTRVVDWSVVERQEPNPPYQRVWLRASGRLPDDPVLHKCVLTYASDMTLLDTTLIPHGVKGAMDGRIMMASLDHAMWFHRPFRADEWMLYVQDTPSAHGGRGLARGSIYTADGRLVVSVVQEGLIRLVDAPSP
jgi:acyl-CoA thioesterase-2